MNQIAKLNVLIACEESQAECIEFRNLGHKAFSCDIQPCKKKGFPEWHIKDDVTEYLKGKTDFMTQDGTAHKISHWDLIIAHPPCTFLCKVSSVQMYKNPDGWRFINKEWKYINTERYHNMIKARRFFFTCLNAQANYVAVENPLPMKMAGLPKPSSFACPSWFGVRYTRKTLYWTKNLPPLLANYEYSNPVSFVNKSRGKYRSRTFPALAKAIAEQWSEYILNDKKKYN